MVRDSRDRFLDHHRSGGSTSVLCFSVCHGYLKNLTRRRVPLCHSMRRENFFPSSQRRNRNAVCRMLSDREEPTSLDGELRDLLENSMQENPIDEESLRESDKRVFEGITETGANTLQDIADEIKGDLESVQDASQQLASEIIEQETETLLSKYDEERATLLERMNDDKQAIEEELEKIKNLAQLVETPNEADHGVSKTSKVLLIVTALLGLGALYSGFIGLAFSDSESLANGAIDAVVAAISGFLLSRERSKI